MKIADSQISMSGHQHQTTLKAELTELTVSAQTEDQTQASLNQQSTIASVAGDGLTTTHRYLQAESEASITLSLTTTSEEQKQVSRQSSVSTVDGDSYQTASSQLLEHVSQQMFDSEFVVKRSRPAGGSEVNADTVYVTVDNVLEGESEENLSFEALGQVTTEDGRAIDFMLALDFNRNVSSQQLNHFTGQLDLIDPLMINIDGGSVELTDLTFDFDINADGKLDSVSQTAAGSGYLVFDKNHNGDIDNGNEMFGPATGQGFMELSQYDDDGNGWIDEHDAIYSELGLLSFNAGGYSIDSIASVNVGAIYLGAVASDYDLNSSW